MFTLLSGEDVHTADTVPELLAAIFSTPARSLATAIEDCHPALVDIVDRALQLRLADRWPDARAMRTAVREAYGAMYGEAPPDGALSTGAPKQRISHDAIVPVSHGRTREAIAAPEANNAVRRGAPRRIAVAAAVLLAAALGIAGAERVGRSEEPPAGASALL